MVLHTLKAGRYLSLRPAWSTSQSLSQNQDRQTATKTKDPDLSFIPFVRQGSVTQAVLEPKVIFLWFGLSLLSVR